jgi:hypothetical protein
LILSGSLPRIHRFDELKMTQMLQLHNGAVRISVMQHSHASEGDVLD